MRQQSHKLPIRLTNMDLCAFLQPTAQLERKIRTQLWHNRENKNLTKLNSGVYWHHVKMEMYKKTILSTFGVKAIASLYLVHF